jgi:hypothetical protein
MLASNYAGPLRIHDKEARYETRCFRLYRQLGARGRMGLPGLGDEFQDYDH